MSKETLSFVTPLAAEKLQNFFGVFLQFQIGVDTTDNSRTININEGDIHVSVPAGDGRIIADEVRKITRENVNQISRMLMRP